MGCWKAHQATRAQCYGQHAAQDSSDSCAAGSLCYRSITPDTSGRISGQPSNPHNGGYPYQTIKDGQVQGGHNHLLGENLNNHLPCGSTAAIPGNSPVRTGTPLFVMEDSKVITKSLFITKTRQVLAKAGMDASTYKGHSLCTTCSSSLWPQRRPD